jgi:hypothetical protein
MDIPFDFSMLPTLALLSTQGGDNLGILLISGLKNVLLQRIHYG